MCPGKKVTIQSVQVVHVSNEPGDATPAASGVDATANGFAIEVTTEPAISFFSLDYHEEQGPSNTMLVKGLWQQDRFKPDASWIKEMVFPDGLPSGKVTLKVRDMHFRIDGRWQVQWQPPVTP